MLKGGAVAPTFRQLSRELRRIDVDTSARTGSVNVRRSRLRSRVRFWTIQGELEWRGTVADVLARLASVQDGAGTEGFWQALVPDKADRFFRERDARIATEKSLQTELKRVGAVGAFFGGGAEIHLGNPYRKRSEPYDAGSCYVYEKIVRALEPDVPSGDTSMVERWSGSPDEAFTALATLPDDAGLITFWRLFDPGIAAEPRIALEETRRVEDRALEREVERLGVGRLDVAGAKTVRQIDFRAGLGTPGQPLVWTAYDLRWGQMGLEESRARWAGRAADALERLQALPDNSGADQVWRALET